LSDLTDKEWFLMSDLTPVAKSGERRGAIEIREILTAIFYLLKTDYA
jgi:transposase